MRQDVTGARYSCGRIPPGRGMAVRVMRDVKDKMDKIAVLIPCYNEAATISKVVRDFRAALPEAVIYVYDNNSTDDTGRIAEAEGAVVRHEYRQGKGNVIRSMFREIEAECYIMVDGDDTYPADEAALLAEPVLAGRADMVIGDRLSATYFTENKRPFHNVGNRVVRGLINHIFSSNVRDIMTGYRAFSWLFVKGFPILSRNFEIETEMTVHCLDKNFRIEEVPVTYRDRPEGSVSKLNTFRDGMGVLKTIASLFRDYRPMSFFSIIGTILMALALLMFVPVFAEYLQTGLVARFPTLIVAGFAAIAGILMFITGILLHCIEKKHKQLYELFLNQISMR